jgi:hypothetical protein
MATIAGAASTHTLVPKPDTRGGFKVGYFSWLRVGSAMAVALSSAILLSGPAAAAQSSHHSASTCAKLTSGKPVTVTISEPGQQPCYTFLATANKNVTFVVKKFHFTNDGSAGSVDLLFYAPGNTTIQYEPYINGNSYFNITPQVSGTWTIVVVPYEDSVGSLTLTFANNVPTQALTPGKPVTTKIKYPGQEGGYTFTATANKTVTFKLTHFHFTNDGQPGTVFLDFYEPGNTTIQANPYFSANGHYKFTPQVGGTWTITLDPSGAAVGSLTLELT